MHSMLKTEVKGIYADVMERALYNTVLAGVAADGKSYFYVNPMEVVPEASEKNPARTHVKATRQKWHACACCPPNVGRLLASIGKYLYTFDDEAIYFHMYAASEATVGNLSFSVQTEYPLDGKVVVTVNKAANATLAFRIPDWCEDFQIKDAEIKDGYAYVTRDFVPGDVIEINMKMAPRVVYANSKIRADAGKVCIQRGPLVYCLEECDNGSNLHSLLVDSDGVIEERHETIGGMQCVVLTVPGFAEESQNDEMYSFAAKKRKAKQLTFVPYHLWGNRVTGEMLVWVREA